MMPFSFCCMLCQIFMERALGLEGKEEVIFLFMLFMQGADMVFHIFVPDNSMIFFCVFPQSCQNLGRMTDIDDKDAVEHTDYKGKSQIMGQPV